MTAADVVRAPIAIGQGIADARARPGTPMPLHDAAGIGGRQVTPIESAPCFHSGGGAALPLAPVVRRIA